MVKVNHELSSSVVENKQFCFKRKGICEGISKLIQ